MADRFSEIITHWYSLNKRDLPWRNTSDPYLIWLSEILLQQTRVDQGLPYYLKFKKHYPTIHHLAKASLDEVLKHWQGLGYYSRARNMHYTACEILEKRNGVFPDTYDDILALKGVGKYTAAAISSFAYDLPKPVIDGNVIRIISRYFGVEEPFDTKIGMAQIEAIANNQIDQNQPGIYNQSIMEFGSLQCTVKNPDCNFCPLQNSCFAFQNNKVDSLPLKSKKTKVKEVFFHYIFIQKNGKTFIEQRPSKGIWNSMYQFPMLEYDNEQVSVDLLLNDFEKRGLKLKEPKLLNKRNLNHKLSHRKIHAIFWEFDPQDVKILPKSSIFEIDSDGLKTKYAIPKLLDNFLSLD